MLIIIKFFEKYRFGSKFANISILVKKSLKISILVNIYENLDFGENCRKILLLGTIFGKSRF